MGSKEATIRRTVLALAAMVVIAGAAPGTAGAVTVTVTGDDGNPVPIAPNAGPTIRNMSPKVSATLAPGEGPRWMLTVLDPAGALAPSFANSCWSNIITNDTANANYRGNGTYTAIVRFYASGDTNCQSPTSEQRFPFAVTASTGVTAPAGPVLTREPNSVVAVDRKLAVALNPGAGSYEVRYAAGGVIGADGAIAGPSAEAFVDQQLGQASFRFERPGRYAIVARAKEDEVFTPWSAPATVTALAPFDFEDLTFPDDRGPSYRIRGRIRERTASGRVTIRIARGKRGNYKRLGRPRIGRNGLFTLRFKRRSRGAFRMRFSYRGSSTVAAGQVAKSFRITRRLFFG